MKVVSFDGLEINDGGTYMAWLRSGVFTVPPSQATYVGRHRRRPLIRGKELGERRLMVEVWVVSATPYADRVALKQVFDPDEFVSKQFVIEDDDGSNDRYVMATVEELELMPGGVGRIFMVTLAVDGDVRWRSVAEDSEGWAITASGQTNTFTNNGETNAFPVITIEPTDEKTGDLPFKRWVAIRWPVDEAVSGFPLSITDGGLDTQIASTNFAQADGDDLRVWVDGVEVDRWLNGINTANTHVWCNLDFEVAAEIELEAEMLSGATVDTIDVVVPTGTVLGKDVGDFMVGFPSEGILLIDSEAFTYTGKNDQLGRFTGVTRAAKGTTAATHDAGDTVIWIQHDIWILYGDASIGAPDLDSDREPILDLANSENGVWVYADFGENDRLRSGAIWRFGKSPGIQGVGSYTGSEATAADPWAVLGLQAQAPDDPGVAYWQIYHPFTITDVDSITGKKYAGSTTAKWGGFYLESSVDGVNWTQEVSESAPSAPDTWEALTGLTAGASVAAGRKYLRLALYYNHIDEDEFGEIAAIGLNFPGANLPDFLIGAEQGNYSLEATITNNETGEAVVVSFPMELDEVLEIDTNLKVVTYLADGSSQFQVVTLAGGVRMDWLSLVPGDNEFQFDDVGTNGVTVTLDWEKRFFE